MDTNLGRITFNLRGEWSATPTEPYKRLDVVSYNGESFAATKDLPAGEPQVGNADWQLLARKGEVTSLSAKATPTTVPEMTGFVAYAVSEAGTYNNFLDSTGTAIEVTTSDLESGAVQLWGQDGVFEKHIIPVDLTAYVANSDLEYTNSSNILDPAYLITGKAPASNGNIGNSPNYVSIIGLPVSGLSHITASGMPVNPAANWSFMDGSSAVLEVGQITVSPLTLSVPAGAVTFNMYGGNGSAPPELRVNAGETSLPYEPFRRTVSKIKDKNLTALSLLPGNSVPTPEDAANAVNKGYFDNNAVRNEDLEVAVSNNIANTFIEGQYINTSGGVSAGAGWAMCEITGIADGQDITFGNFQIDQSGYAAFYNGTTLMQFMGNYTNASLPETYTWPAGATRFLFDVKRPVNSEADYAKTMANLGATLLPYEDPSDKVVGIKGKKIGGSSNVEAFEDLADVPAYTGNANKGLKVNATEDGVTTFEPVEGGSDVTFGTVTASGWVLELPSGASEPAGLEVGDAWIETTTGNVKVKLS